MAGIWLTIALEANRLHTKETMVLLLSVKALRNPHGIMADFPPREAPGEAEAAAEGAAVPPPLDTAWAESTRKKALLKLEKLDTDLKNYKGNSIKESIRFGLERGHLCTPMHIHVGFCSVLWAVHLLGFANGCHGTIQMNRQCVTLLLII